MDDDRLKKIEVLLEKMIEELIMETPIYAENMLPIPTETFMEMEMFMGKQITLIGLS